MLINTFCHIPRISINKERELWCQGVLTWEDYRGLAKNTDYLDESKHQLQKGDPLFFANAMKYDQHWRLFSDFRHSVAYIDIETTGFSKYYDEITTIALYDGREVKTYVNGKNLEQFKEDIVEYKLLVSFNGKTFDIPFIESYFGIRMRQAHIDLRYVLGRLGYSGGLKQIERQMGFDRGNLSSVNGYFAVFLWGQYKARKNEAALKTLLAYNCADVINLELLMVEAYNLNLKNTPFSLSKQLPTPGPVNIPFDVDTQLIRQCAC
jgi:uncharacterized protein YprB with RNaseH-like and TPR domain